MLDYALMPLKKYAQFTGRSRRAEFWWYVLAVLIVSAILGAIEGALGMQGYGRFARGPLTGLLTVALFIPNLALGFRRLHDTNRSAWWLLLWLIPVIGWLALLYFYVQDGTPGPNRFGEDPKGRGAESAPVAA